MTRGHFLKLVTASFVLATLVCPAFAQIVDDQANTTVNICNNADDDALVLMVHKHFYNPNRRMLGGWYRVTKKQCLNLRNIPRGPLYFFAERAGKPSQWSGTDLYVCIDKRQTERTIFDKEECIQGEEKRGFFMRDGSQPTTSVQLAW